MTPIADLTAILIAVDEAARIAECLATLAFCTRRIVVDGGSRDDTPAHARAAGAEVHHRVFDGFGAQKAFALSLVRTRWTLSVDADERVTPALADEIRRTLARPHHDGYRIPRLNHIGARPIRRAGWQHDRPLRLFSTAAGRFDPAAQVHEVVHVDGAVGQLQSPLLHYSYRDLDELDARARTYGAMAARARGGPPRPVQGVTHAAARFVRSYVLRAGFTEGRAGLRIARAQATEAWLKYAAPPDDAP